MTALSLLTTIVVVLQLIGGSFHIGPIPFSLVLVPIAVGAVLYGPLAGGFLGTVFGIVVLIGGITGSDQFTFFLWSASPFWTAAVCLVKGALAGVVSGLVYRALQRHVTLGCVLAALVCPIVNTGIFALAMLTVLREKLAELAGGSDDLLRAVAAIEQIGVIFTSDLGAESLVQVASKEFDFKLDAELLFDQFVHLVVIRGLVAGIAAENSNGDGLLICHCKARHGQKHYQSQDSRQQFTHSTSPFHLLFGNFSP